MEKIIELKSRDYAKLGSLVQTIYENYKDEIDHLKNKSLLKNKCFFESIENSVLNSSQSYEMLKNIHFTEINGRRIADRDLFNDNDCLNLEHVHLRACFKNNNLKENNKDIRNKKNVENKNKKIGKKFLDENKSTVNYIYNFILKNSGKITNYALMASQIVQNLFGDEYKNTTTILLIVTLMVSIITPYVEKQKYDNC